MPPRNATEQRGIIAEMLKLVIRYWTRTDDAYLAKQHIEKLRKLINRGLPQNPAKLGDTRIIVYLAFTLPNGELLGCEVLLNIVSIRHHGAKLIDMEGPSIPAHTHLRVDWSSLGIYSNRNGQQCARDETDNGHTSRECNIKGALNKTIAKGPRVNGLAEGDELLRAGTGFVGILGAL